MPDLLILPGPETDLPDSDVRPVVVSIDRPEEAQARLRAALMSAAKAEAARRIEAIAPIWKQANLFRDSGLAAPEFAMIDAVRAASNALEVAIAATPDDELAATWTAAASENEEQPSPLALWAGWPATGAV